MREREIQAPGPADLLAAVRLRTLALETRGVELSDTDRAVGQHLAATFAAWQHGWPAASTRMSKTAALLR